METVRVGTLEYLAAPNIAVPHGFTTRLGGVSQGAFSSLNIAMERGDPQENVAKNFQILANALGFDPKNAVLTRQTHSDRIRTVTKADHLGLNHHLYPQCDALITADPGCALVVYTADCTPILLWDSLTGAVGAVHAGWRGTAASLAGKTAEKMVRVFGCKPENIRAAIGPNIGPCCFATDADVPQAMRSRFGPAAEKYIRFDGQKYYVNLKALNALSLQEAGVTGIAVSDACTACQPNRFWSHRITGGIRGSQGGIIVCKEAQT